jgi:hypothetical protein
LPKAPNYTTRTQSVCDGLEYHPRLSVPCTGRLSCGKMKDKQRGKAGAAAEAQEVAKEVAGAGASWGAEVSGLLGFWVWGRCLFRFSTAAGLSVSLRRIGVWFCCTISHLLVLV